MGTEHSPALLGWGIWCFLGAGLALLLKGESSIIALKEKWMAFLVEQTPWSSRVEGVWVMPDVYALLLVLVALVGVSGLLFFTKKLGAGALVAGAVFGLLLLGILVFGVWGIYFCPLSLLLGYVVGVGGSWVTVLCFKGEGASLQSLAKRLKKREPKC